MCSTHDDMAYDVEVNEVNNKLMNFIAAMRAQPENVWQGVYDILYRLYKLRLTEVRDAEVIFGQAGLSILLSSTFYEHVRTLHGLPYVSVKRTYKGVRP